ncbi:MAG TPA: tetratricopeptide repeat protein [Pyrinomonadaceae bacterium]
MKPAIVLFLCFAGAALGQAPGPSTHPGIVLYGQAKYSEAIRSLEIATKSNEHKTDADIWNYLGLAYFAKGELKKSYKAFEKSVDLSPSSSIFRANLADAYLATGAGEKGAPVGR